MGDPMMFTTKFTCFAMLLVSSCLAQFFSPPVSVQAPVGEIPSYSDRVVPEEFAPPSPEFVGAKSSVHVSCPSDMPGWTSGTWGMRKWSAGGCPSGCSHNTFKSSPTFNGCGSGGITLSKSNKFTPACNYHDVC